MIDLCWVSVFGLDFFLMVIIFAFLCELVDSSLGMGYGTTLTPMLLIMGFGPLAIVPGVLLSEFITGVLAGAAHHKAGNVSFKRGSMHLSIALVLAACSIIGATLAVVVAVSIPEFWLKLYIGAIVLIMGVLIIVTFNRELRFSWGKITGLGLIAAFNKGMSGGGYGPVVTGGQILSGVNGNHAVGITSLAEGLTCVVGVLIYLISPQIIDWGLAPSLVIGAILSIPFSTFIVKRISTTSLKLAIATLTVVLGSYTLYKVLILT